MEVVRKVLIVGALLGAGAGVGSALFALVTPGEQKIQEMLKEMPELDKQHRAEAARNKESSHPSPVASLWDGGNEQMLLKRLIKYLAKHLLNSWHREQVPRSKCLLRWLLADH
ncbi:PREDICTED: UPF0723 protein C11orf83 homolog [Elephantulus edwardii]|uniref:UPF0723 protein C11orf83 homolog n=1 Tax=Elephantulus edwardii TaxID=28737 RepID=UPI0003F0B56B|nr:PREDICTED: UPF0723 protein C11orf83 homolog [Elephantulus edwardii]